MRPRSRSSRRSRPRSRCSGLSRLWFFTDKWRFVFNGYDYDELYDLENDPGQMKNIASDPAYEAVKKEMYTRIWEFGLAHEEQMINEYIMTAMADYGPGIAIED